ncbi:MAG: KpsF/GutQ family sugar-phosphate isomerase, partial [Giesbergeria sp.]
MHAASVSTRPFDPEQALRLGRETFEIEAAALNQLAGALGAPFCDAVRAILLAPGRVVVMG